MDREITRAMEGWMRIHSDKESCKVKVENENQKNRYEKNELEGDF